MSEEAATSVPGRHGMAASSATRLARQVVALAAAGGWRAGRHVTEAELVSALGVSRTPVRTALKLLSREGVLDARPNQGFFLVREGAALAAFDLEHVPTAVEGLYVRLLRDRIAGTLPHVISPAQLMSLYGIGRAVMVQALGRLADDGLVLRGGGRSLVFVETLTDAGSVLASYEFRFAIEPASLRAAGLRIAREPLIRLRDRHRALVERLDAPDGASDLSASATRLRASIVGLDADFHEGLADLSGNPFAAAAIKQQVALRRLLEFGIQERPSRVTLWCYEHLAVIDALLADDREEAALRLDRHLAKALDRATGSRDRIAR